MPLLTVEGKTYCYKDVGQGYPLLFGHSYLWTSEMWAPQIEVLSKNFRCIAVDLWDHGGSGHLSSEPCTLETLADDYWKLMQALNIPEFAVIGLSVGGMWATHLALQHPESIRALVIMDSYVGEEPEATYRYYCALLDKLEQHKGFTEALLDQVIPLFFSPYTLSHRKQLADDLRHALSSIPEENIPGVAALGRAIFSRKCLLKHLPKIYQPTCIIVGADDLPRPPREAEEMFSRLPHAELHVIERAGHISNLEEPETISAILTNFLTEHLSHVSSI